MVTLTNNGSLYARARQRNNQQPQPAAAVAPVVQQQPQQIMPQVDPNNAIGSLAELIGPTPAEREARQAQLERNRQKMASWTALFDGLRHLGNLYYTAKGARPQQYANPYTQIEQNYQRDMQLADAQDAYRRQYAQQLYQLQRQQAQDSLAKEVHKSQMDMRKAQADWYGSREESARQKAELDKLKAVRVIKQPNGSLMKFDPITGVAEPLTEADPLYEEYMRSRINKNNRTGTGGKARSGGRSNGTYGYRTTRHVDPATGDIITERVPTTGVQPAGKEQPAKKTTKPAKNNSSSGKGGNQGNKGKKKVDW